MKIYEQNEILNELVQQGFSTREFARYALNTLNLGHTQHKNGYVTYKETDGLEEGRDWLIVNAKVAYTESGYKKIMQTLKKPEYSGAQ